MRDGSRKERKGRTQALLSASNGTEGKLGF
jgi:hypothetical protein